MTSRWITRIGTGRAVALTDAGRDAPHTHLGLAVDVLEAAGAARTADRGGRGKPASFWIRTRRSLAGDRW
jgi:hypothetical protein